MPPVLPRLAPPSPCQLPCSYPTTSASGLITCKDSDMWAVIGKKPSIRSVEASPSGSRCYFGAALWMPAHLSVLASLFPLRP
eukprot:2023380-Rhodomonas_salina.1